MAKTTKKQSKKSSKNSSFNQMAIAGFVLAFIFFPLGLIFSIVALKQINKTNQPGKGLAIAGLVISAIFTAITIWLVFATVNQIKDTQGRMNSGSYSEAKLPPEGSLSYNVETGNIDAIKAGNINALQADLSIYHTKSGVYPSFSDFNSKTWRKSAGMPNSENGEIFCDPLHSSGQKKFCELASSPSKNAYSYQTWQADGSTPCESGPGQSCPKYTLTAVLIQARHNSENPDSIYYVRPTAQYPY